MTTAIGTDRAEVRQELSATAYDLLSKDPSFPPDETPRLQRLKQLGELS